MHSEEVLSQETPVLEADDLVDENDGRLSKVTGAGAILAVRNATRKVVQTPYAHDWVIPGSVGIGANAAMYSVGQDIKKARDSHPSSSNP